MFRAAQRLNCGTTTQLRYNDSTGVPAWLQAVLLGHLINHDVLETPHQTSHCLQGAHQQGNSQSAPNIFSDPATSRELHVEALVALNDRWVWLQAVGCVLTASPGALTARRCALAASQVLWLSSGRMATAAKLAVSLTPFGADNPV